MAWGADDYGQTDVPADLGDVVAITAGSIHALALRSDGAVVAWGDNAYGETALPEGLNNVVAIASGASSLHSVALQRNGEVRVWGDNSVGQTSVPSGLTNVVSVGTGWAHTVALVGDGRPFITLEPSNQKVGAGQLIELRVMAGGNEAKYQWQLNGSSIVGATNAILSVPNSGVSGVYSVTVANGHGSVVSRNVQVIVRPPQKLMAPAVSRNGIQLRFGDADGTPMTAKQIADFRVLVSTDLRAWQELGTEIVATNSCLMIKDTNAISPMRYYRVIENWTGSH